MTPRLAAVAAVLLLAGCPASPGAAPVDAARARPNGAAHQRTVPKGSPVPGYEAVKQGEVYVFELAFTSCRYDHVVSRSASELVVERTSILMKQAQTPQEIHEPLVSDGNPYWPGGVALSSSFHKVAEEKVEASGRAFDCDVYEALGPGQTARYWVAPTYPFVVRATVNDKPTLQLKEILAGMPDGPVLPGAAPPQAPALGDPPK
jgi:hypothetical protein